MNVKVIESIIARLEKFLISDQNIIRDCEAFISTHSSPLYTEAVSTLKKKIDFFTPNVESLTEEITELKSLLAEYYDGKID